MSYQVLARKWRPRSFAEMVGQEHVLKALINALDHNRLHHAYLFTGTRGVGKTTVARILAKCLNCETGVGSSPCGVCSTCVEINEGRFVDLIEVDAASRTKVEDTRELLDNVQYSPTSGRFKIYLIDEVHMLSNSSFNALLKTLEEPPAHVKFLLATTDPQKLPATILSRCLQFNLKNMSPEKIVAHLQTILSEEMVPFEEAALWQLARAADGSMRDALSLTDQAIAFGNGKLSELDVSAMLGSIDHKFIQNIIAALIDLNGAKLLDAVAQFAEHAPDYAAALADLQTLLHRIAIAQALPEALDNSYGDRQQILQFARQLTPEDVQLFYQTALMGQRDLNLCPIPRTGFEMVLLRMLAFKPQALVEVPKNALSPSTPAEPEAPTGNSQVSETAIDSDVDTNNGQTQDANLIASDANTADSSEAREEAAPAKKSEAPGEPEAAPVEQETAAQQEPEHIDAQEIIANAARAENVPVETNATSEHVAIAVQTREDAVSKIVQKPSKAELLAGIAEIENRPRKPSDSQSALAEQPTNPAQASEIKPVLAQHTEDKIPFDEFSASRWIELFFKLPISGVLKMTASNLVCVGREQSTFHFVQDERAGGLLNSEHAKYLGDALSDYFTVPCRAEINIATVDSAAETPAQFRERRRQEQKAAAIEDLKSDPVVIALQQQFGAVLNEESVIVHEEKL